MTGTNPERIDALRLVPKQAPGRSSRRARGFGPQIRALQAQGYTLDAIREALAEAGVVVSRSTVHREATRDVRPSRTFGSTRTDTPLKSLGECGEVRTVSNGPVPVVGDEESPGPAAKGKDIAAAFMDGRITNALIRAQLRAKENP